MEATARCMRVMRPVLAAVALLALSAVGATRADPAAPCAPKSFEGARYTVCAIDTRVHALRLFWKDDAGEPYAGFRRLPRKMAGARLVFAMNAGMYRADLSPAGLYVEDGQRHRRANTRDGPGNFHMKPNGVFYVAGRQAGVLETDAFLALDPPADIATQSGPMLVIEGLLHPRFLPHSTSRKRRNGVGVRDGHTVLFAISEGTVTFHAFARLFRDGLGVDNALFLDGTGSSLYAPALGRADAFRPLGPIVAAYARE